MNNLTRFDNDGLELVIDTKTGEAYATQSGYARMSGKAKMTISDRVSKLVRLEGVKKAEIDTGYGIKVVNLIPAELVFEWLMSDRPELALAMGKAGATVYLHQIAGFKIGGNATTKTPVIESQKPTFVLTPTHLDLLRAAISLENSSTDGFLLDRLQLNYPELAGEVKAAKEFVKVSEATSKRERLHPCLPLSTDLLDAMRSTSESTVSQFLKKDLKVTNAKRRSELLPILRAFAVQNRLPLA